MNRVLSIARAPKTAPAPKLSRLAFAGIALTQSENARRLRNISMIAQLDRRGRQQRRARQTHPGKRVRRW